MSTPIIVAIVVVAIIVVAAVAAAAMMASRRSRLRERFGPEYDRVVEEQQSQRKGEAELASRERRVRGLDIQPLSASARADYTARWDAVQAQFVDEPQQAVTAAHQLVMAVMTDRGYPVDDLDQVTADLSVEHAATIGHFRAARDISERADQGQVSTEDLRQAMIHYRELFSDLLRDPADETANDTVAGDTVAGDTATGETVADDAVTETPVAEMPATDESVVEPTDPDEVLTGQVITDREPDDSVVVDQADGDDTDAGLTPADPAAGDYVASESPDAGPAATRAAAPTQVDEEIAR